MNHTNDLFYSIYTANDTNSFKNVEPTFHFLQKSHLVNLSYSSYVLLHLIDQYSVRIFAFVFTKEVNV